MKKYIILPMLAAGCISAQAAVVSQYSFENNLNDSAAGGAMADTLSYVQASSTSVAAQFSSGVVGSAGVFDGNYFTAADSNDLDLATTEWTIEFYVSLSSSHTPLWDRAVLKWGGTNDYHLAMLDGDPNFYDSSVAQVVPQSNTAPATDFADGNWHHVALTSSAAGSEMWIDGTSVFTGGTITLANGTDSLALGDSAVGADVNSRLNGLMDEVVFHDAAVDQTYVDARVALIAVPEPSSAALLGLGGLALILRRRK